jgi:Domain of unknown function (DUF397)
MSDSHAIALSWRKSSASGTGDCVEVALSNQRILVRDSKKRLPYILEFTFSEWRAFLSGVHAGEFDPESLGASGARGPEGPHGASPMQAP